MQPFYLSLHPTQLSQYLEENSTFAVRVFLESSADHLVFPEEVRRASPKGHGGPLQDPRGLTARGHFKPETSPICAVFTGRAHLTRLTGVQARQCSEQQLLVRRNQQNTFFTLASTRADTDLPPYSITNVHNK